MELDDLNFASIERNLMSNIDADSYEDRDN